jgi:sensor histidine kinase YesM
MKRFVKIGLIIGLIVMALSVIAYIKSYPADDSVEMSFFGLIYRLPTLPGFLLAITFNLAGYGHNPNLFQFLFICLVNFVIYFGICLLIGWGYNKAKSRNQ